jgi:hypothetical protein
MKRSVYNMNLLREYIREILSENWRQYLKDRGLEELPLGATTGPLAEPGREVYEFESPEERWEYTQWKYPKAKRHKFGITWEDFYHALAIGGRPLPDYADESAEEWERRRAEERQHAEEKKV